MNCVNIIIGFYSILASLSLLVFSVAPYDFLEEFSDFTFEHYYGLFGSVNSAINILYFFAFIFVVITVVTNIFFYLLYSFDDDLL